MEIIIPKGYSPKLSLYQTQTAIGMLKKIFEENLCQNLNLKRVSAPLFVTSNSGLNDNLNGVERPVSFKYKAGGDEELEIVHSLAKWKRLALAKYHFNVDEGLYTDMNAIRRDEELDNLHSIYVDQWDWEKVILKENRNLDYLKNTIIKICKAIKATNLALNNMYPMLTYEFDDDVFFITTKELEELYPSFTPKERENAIVKKHHTVFLMQIGCPLSNGKPHDGRAPDYDDWMLNGDLLVYNHILDCAFEISSMGIRVDEKSLKSQLEQSNCIDRLNLDFHKLLINNELPLTIGGGIGQSRLSMLLLEKAHIGEVQVSVWDKKTKDICLKNKIILL